MNKLFLFVVLILSACAQLQKGQTQPVLAKDLKQNIWVTNCGGAVEVWGSCYDKAKETCKDAYTVLSRVENQTGTKRELTFQCKTKAN